MKRISIAEANRNLSSLARIVEEDGIAILTRHGKDRYVFMSMDHYESSGLLRSNFSQEIAQGLFAKTESGEIVYIAEKNGIATVYTAQLDEGTPSFISITTAPMQAVECKAQNDALEVRILPKAQVKESFIEPDYMDEEDKEHIEALKKIMKHKDDELELIKITGPLEVLKERG